MTITSQSPEETESAAAELAGSLERGDVVLVAGELGAGKTTFVRGACRALGVRGPVTSPTFAIGQVYRGERDGHALEVAHLDLYRMPFLLAGEQPGLLEDYLTSERFAFVEWPAVAPPGGLGRVRARVRLEHLSPRQRSIEVER